MHVVALDAGSLGGNLHHTKEVARVDRGYQPQLGVDGLPISHAVKLGAGQLRRNSP